MFPNIYILFLDPDFCRGDDSQLFFPLSFRRKPESRPYLSILQSSDFEFKDHSGSYVSNNFQDRLKKIYPTPVSLSARVHKA
jgi:hypothetical protein